MEFQALTQLVSAVCATAKGRRVILFGSSSLFASFPDADPVLIGAAVTIDADFFIEPDDFDVRQTLVADLGEDALIKAGLLDFTELDREVQQLDHESALIVECGRVVDEVRSMAGI
jgi:hypothetical protein